MQTITTRLRFISIASLCVMTSAVGVFGQSPAENVGQPARVIEAYRVCEQFQKLMAEDLDFDRAFEATFTKNPKRRREIAIVEGEFGNLNLTRVDDATLVDAFKSRMQIFYLMLPLASPDSKEEEDRFFPPAIKAIFNRKPPAGPREFSAYAVQLKRDATDFRIHLQQLQSNNPTVAERVEKFKAGLSKEISLPSHKVEPLTAYSRGRVLGLRDPYYQIGDYAVIREGNEMKIIGIRFFSRLF